MGYSASCARNRIMSILSGPWWKGGKISMSWWEVPCYLHTWPALDGVCGSTMEPGEHMHIFFKNFYENVIHENFICIISFLPLFLWPLLPLKFVTSSFIIIVIHTYIQPADSTQCCSYVYGCGHMKLENLPGGSSMEKRFFLSQQPFVAHSSTSRGGTIVL